MKAPHDVDRLSLTVHEVRSPVAALVALAAELAERRTDETTTRRLLELSIAACRAIDRVVHDAILDIELREGVDVAQVARDAVAAAALTGARVRVEVGSGDARLTADAIRLRQAIDNLIANARVHGGADGEILVRIAVDDHAVRVSVSDAGTGIAPGDLARIFERRVRLEDSRPGSGLGLSVVRAVAEAHGGSAVSESRAGEGATFTISLPRGKR